MPAATTRSSRAPPSERYDAPSSPHHRVWVLTDGGSINGGALFPALVKQHGLGTLVGRPTGGPDAVTFGNAFLLSMPNTDLVFRLASARVAFGEDDTPDVRGVQPDVPVERSVHDAVRGIDTDLVRVFELIDERRATLAGDD